MSFLAGRLAGKEGAFFYEETKRVVTRLSEKIPSSIVPSVEANPAVQADVLPEVLRHSLPSQVISRPLADCPFLSSKWVLHSSNSCNLSATPSDLINPLRNYVSIPQVTFGPKRWELPSGEHTVMVSTANELRRDRYIPASSDKIKAAATGLTMIVKAFAVATTIVFGGGAVIFGAVASNLELRNIEDVQTKVKDRAQPRFEMIKEQMAPLRSWAEETSRKWHVERNDVLKEKPIIKELSKILGAKTDY